MNFISPLAVYLDESNPKDALAPRPFSLDGKVVGLLPNWRPAAVRILEALGALLKERYRLKAVVIEQRALLTVHAARRQGKSLIESMREQLDDFALRIDVAIIASGD